MASHMTQCICSENIKLLRLITGHKQKDIAELLNISRTSYSCLESGKRIPDFETLHILSDYYRISLGCLISMDISHWLLNTLSSRQEKSNQSKMQPHLENFRKNIKFLRISKGFSQEDVAIAVSMARSTYSTYETGTKAPDIITVLALSSLYDIAVDTIFSNDLSQAQSRLSALHEHLHKNVDCNGNC